jgi:hypothetical protein
MPRGGCAGTFTFRSVLRRQARHQHAHRDQTRHATGHVEVAPFYLRHRDGRHAQERALHGSGDGAGIGDVVPKVRAVIDARHDQHRGRRQEAEDRQVYAVGGRAVDREAALTEAVRPERPVQRQRVAAGGLSRSGATTYTSPSSASAFSSAAKPGRECHHRW